MFKQVPHNHEGFNLKLRFMRKGSVLQKNSMKLQMQLGMGEETERLNACVQPFLLSGSLSILPEGTSAERFFCLTFCLEPNVHIIRPNLCRPVMSLNVSSFTSIANRIGI